MNYCSMYLEFVGLLIGGLLWLMVYFLILCFGINDNIWIWFFVYMQVCLGGKVGGFVDSIVFVELMLMGFDKNKGIYMVFSCGFIFRVQIIL